MIITESRLEGQYIWIEGYGDREGTSTGLIKIRIGVNNLEVNFEGGSMITCQKLYEIQHNLSGLPFPLQLNDCLELDISEPNLISILSLTRDGVIHSTEMPQPVSPPACQFIDYLQNRKVARVDLREKADWFEGAFHTTMGAGNPANSQITIENAATKKLILRSIYEMILSLAGENITGQTTFDQIIFNSIEHIERAANQHNESTLFTFGRAQKLINISLKYIYAWWSCRGLPSPLYGDVSWIEKWAPYLHVPIDRYTLEHLVSHGYKSLVFSGGYFISWKWHMGKPRYCRMQDAIRLLSAKSEMKIPLEYEMKYIWTPPNDENVQNALGSF